MINPLLNIILRNKQIISIVVAVASIGIYMAPTNAFAFVLGGTSGSITGQFLGQQNSISATNTGDNGQVSASDNTQANIGANIADVNVGSSGTGSLPGVVGFIDFPANVGSGTGSLPGIVGTPDTSSHTDVQVLGQSNSITATNTGVGGNVQANNNNQANLGFNLAHIGVGASGAASGAGPTGVPNGGSSSHTDLQILRQQNSLDASNSGTGVSVQANNNHELNIGINAAHVSVPQPLGILGSFVAGISEDFPMAR